MNSIKFLENALPVSDYILLTEEAYGNPCSEKAAEKTLNNSLFIIHAEINGKVVAMARILANNNLSYHLTDIIVTPKYQSKGIGKMIMERVIQYAHENLDIGSSKNLGLFSPKSKESFYEKFGFKSQPQASLHTGIKMYLKKEE